MLPLMLLSCPWVDQDAGIELQIVVEQTVDKLRTGTHAPVLVQPLLVKQPSQVCLGANRAGRVLAQGRLNNGKYPFVRLVGDGLFLSPLLVLGAGVANRRFPRPD